MPLITLLVAASVSEWMGDHSLTLAATFQTYFWDVTPGARPTYFNDADGT